MEVDGPGVELIAEFEDGVEVFEKAVDAGVGAESEEMCCMVCVAGVCYGLDEGLVVSEFACGTGLGDADGFLIDDSACADVLVPDFGVSHGAVGEPYIEAAGVDEGVGILVREAISNGCLGEVNSVERVVFGVWILSPSVTDDDEEWGVVWCWLHGEAYAACVGRFIVRANARAL